MNLDLGKNGTVLLRSSYNFLSGNCRAIQHTTIREAAETAFEFPKKHGPVLIGIQPGDLARHLQDLKK